MKVIKMEVGHLGTNCYIAYCEQTQKAVVIDPGSNGNELLALLQRENLTVEYIINTHGHADHIGANDQLKAATKAPVLIHKEDAGMLTSAHRNLSAFIGGGFEVAAGDRLLEEGDVIECGSLRLKVIHTPGHTPGGICLLAGDVLFSGDTLFAESIGRTDFPGGSYKALIQNIKEKLMILPDDVKVCPGHGPDTTIGWERKMNSFIA
ncbi:MAG TPA: MBL fold metallo-hydrolase [Patescibacteria group bacterium]|nr:MBL fold metallo-hydrolase [Patescibacteria group bacterium]